MKESIIISERVRHQISARATLVGLGVKVKHMGVLEVIKEQVKIAQKTVKYTPNEKLTDGLVAVLSGAKGLVEVNKRVRSDPALQAAFGRQGCAEQSVVQDTLDACTAENVKQMEQATDRIFRQHSRAYRHDYTQAWQLLDVDMTGRPCGRKAEFASKGYFAKQRNRRGRQEGYVVASWYDEIVVKRVYNGTTQLSTAMQALIQAAQQTLSLTQQQRRRTILRIDAGGEAISVTCNVLNKAGLESAARQVVDTFGRVDILINGAGGNKPQATTSPEQSFFDLPAEALRWVFDLNLMGAILPSQVFGRLMAGQKSGVILNISSMNALRPLTRIPAYSAAKAGVSNFTQWLAVHMAQNYSPNIRVNAIAPGFFVGEQNRHLLLNEDGSLTPRGRSIIDHTPQGRFGTPEDLLGTVLWLVSPASEFVTGIVVPVDGGFSAFSGV